LTAVELGPNHHREGGTPIMDIDSGPVTEIVDDRPLQLWRTGLKHCQTTSPPEICGLRYFYE
jgi:hypothetical protein